MMFHLILICVLSFFKLCMAITISDDDYKLLPQLYDMDDYFTCNRERNVYCKIKLILMPNDRNNKLWHIIMEAKKENYYIDHDVIYRARCVPRKYIPYTEKFMTYITDVENRKLENISLHTEVDTINCENDAQKLSVKDYFVLWFIFGYLIITIFVTVIDMLSRRKVLRADLSNHKIVTILSIVNSWDSLRKPITNEDYNKLKCFQGFRIFIICTVLGGHGAGLAAAMFVTNTRMVENLSSGIIGPSAVTFMMHVIQPNFLMSGWLLTIQVYNAVEKSDNKKLPLKVVGQALLSRYLRFILALMFYIGLSNLLKMYLTGPQRDIFEADSEACRTHWWGNLLSITNFFYAKNMCNFASWYLSCDFQAYVACMVLFYLMYKFNFGMYLFGGIFLLVGIINTYILYNAYNLHVIDTVVTCPMKANFIQLENFLKNDHGYYFHTSFFQNFSSFLVGILFGVAYYRYKNTQIKVTKAITIMWAVGFCGLPVLVLVLAIPSYSPFLSAIVGSLLKPLFSMGIGIGMLGMSHNIGGSVKKICEARPIEFMSRWILSTYVFHPLALFYILSTWKDMPELSYMFIQNVILCNIILAVLLGLILHLLIERPLSKVVNLIITKWIYKQKTQ